MRSEAIAVDLLRLFPPGSRVAGGGEILTAIKAGADPDRLVLHGNAKTDEELEIAVRHGLGRDHASAGLGDDAAAT